MEELLESSIVNGFIFSVYGELGPSPLYVFPNYVSEKELKELKKKNANEDSLILSYRDVTQISIKNLVKCP